MADDLKMRDLVVVDEFVTPRIATYVFWVLEVANLLFWVQFIRAASAGMLSSGWAALGVGAIQTEGGAAPLKWWPFVVGIVMLAASAVVIRVLVELVLVFFRWQKANQDVLAALAGNQPVPRGSAPSAPGTPVQPLAVSPSPPWEGQKPGAPPTP
jgi:hypothetical protein